MKNLHKLLFLSLSLMSFNFINTMEEQENESIEKEAEEKKEQAEQKKTLPTLPIEISPLSEIATKHLVNKALKEYTSTYEESQSYDHAYQVFTNSFKGLTEEILFEEIYCHLIHKLKRADIFIRKLVKEFENSNEEERNQNVLELFFKFCIEAQSSIITSIVREMNKYADLKSDILQNLAIFLTQNLQNKETISYLENSLGSLEMELTKQTYKPNLQPEELKPIVDKFNFNTQLLDILGQKHVVSVKEELIQFPDEIQQKGLQLLELYKTNNMVKFKSELKELSNEIKHKILMFYLENYLVTNNNFEIILNAKTTEHPEITHGMILAQLIYYLSPQPIETLITEVNTESPSITSDAKAAKEIFAKLFIQLSSAYPKTIELIYSDLIYFLFVNPVDIIKDTVSLINTILNDYIYWLGIEFNTYIKNKEIKDAADLILEFYKNVSDTRVVTYLLNDLLVLYGLPLKEAEAGEKEVTANNINIFIEILKEIKSRKIFDPSIYNDIIDGILKFTSDAYNNEKLKSKGLTETQLDKLFEDLKT